MYGKIFDSIYDGTLVDDWRALITFQQMIVLCDADGIIDMTPSAISKRTSIPIEHIKAGIEILEQPDPYSRTPDEEGRRIVRLEDHRPWGWYLVNHKKYKGLQDSDTVREQNRIRKQRQRERQNSSNMSRSVTVGHGSSRHTDTDTDTKTLAQKFARFWEAYPRKKSKGAAEKAFKRINPNEQLLDDILSGIQRAKTSEQWLKDSGQFIPYPATWLNAKGWEDDVVEAPDFEKGVKRL